MAGALVSLAVGCSSGAPSDATGAQTQPLFGNDKAAFDYFRAKGLSPEQAAGIVGNLDQESGVDPTAVQPGGPGRGIAQWSAGGRWDTDANDNASWYATKEGMSVDSLQLQLDFIWYELTNFSGYGLAELKAATTVTAATVAFETKFEGCGTCDESQRISYAEAVLAAYGSDPVGSGDAGSGATPCTVTTTGESGECITTAACAAMAGYESTPGYCPGAADIQCCTKIPSTATDAGGAKPDGGATTSPGSDAATHGGGVDAGATDGSATGGAADGGASATGAGDDASSDDASGDDASGGGGVRKGGGTSASGGCTTSGAGRSAGFGPVASAMLACAAIASRRGRRGRRAHG